MAIKAQLFITCLAEQFFPDVLKRMVGLLERLGVQVEFPEKQTCCGRPAAGSAPGLRRNPSRGLLGPHIRPQPHGRHRADAHLGRARAQIAVCLGDGDGVTPGS
jgi:hypothetical protein